MINQDKWINSLPKNNTRFSETINQIDRNKWINTIPKNDTYNSVKKYSSIAILFIFGLLFVSAVKNETRNLQKEINSLESSINVIRFNLDQAILDNEVINSPENISLLAKEYLNTNLVPYKSFQIKHLNDDVNEKSTKIKKTIKRKDNEKTIKNISTGIKSQVAKNIKKKRTEIRKIQELYYNPKSIPAEIKTQVAKQIKEKKIELKSIYDSPKEIITLKKIQKWGAIQFVKAFLGIPIMPGK